MRRTWLALLLVLAGCSDRQPELHVFNWADYFAPDTIENFEKEFHCKVVLDYYESADALRAKLEGRSSGFDVVFPSDEVMRTLITRGLIETIDLAQVPNFRNLAPRFRNLPFDPANQYSVPYMWGTTGIAYNTKHVNPPPDSWAVLWDERFAGHITILDDAREAFAAAMWLEGHRPDAPSVAAMEKAGTRLLAVRPLAYDSQPKTRLIKGEAWIAHCFSGDALQAAAAEERPADIGYVIPKEGGTMWVDNICIPAGAANRALAHAFIDYLLRPEVSAAISGEVQYGNPNEAASAFIDEALLANDMVNPPPQTLERCVIFGELQPDVKKKLDEGWARVKGR